MTQIKQEFIWSTIDERPLVEIHQWSLTLPAQQQIEFQEACARQDSLKAEAIAEGHLSIDSNGDYIWKNQEYYNQGKGIDPVWEKYWLRWQKECGVVFNQRKIEI